MSYLLIYAVRFYRMCISPLFPPTCRFYPSCSQYALEAVQAYGALKGSWATIKRLSKCHPYHPGGYDPPIHSHEESESKSCYSTID